METYHKITTSLNKFKDGLTATLISAGYIVGIIIGIIGLVLIILESYTFYKVNEINGWPIIKNGGTVIDSFMQAPMPPNSTSFSIFVITYTTNGTAYRTRVAFNYKVNGKNYTSYKYSFYEPWSGNPMIAKAENDIYQKGVKVDIRVNPYNPAEAYISNKPYTTYSKLAIGIIFFLIGIYSFLKF